MIREKVTFLRRLTIILDLCIVAASLVISYYVRNAISPIQHIGIYINVLPFMLVIWGSLLYLFGVYESFRVKRITELLFIIFYSALAGFILFGGVLYILKIQDVSRTVITMALSLSFLFISIEKIVIRLFLRYIRIRGHNVRFLLVVGTGKRARRFAELVERHNGWGLRIAGFIDEDIKKTGELIGNYKVIGSFEDVPKIVEDNVIDEVIFVVPRSWLTKIEKLIRFCELQGLKVTIAVDHFELNFSKLRQSEFDGFPFITFDAPSYNFALLFVKRVFDLIVSGVALIIFSPIMAVLAISIKLTSKGPVFFKQDRSGLNGRKVVIRKFRTMIDGAESQRDSLLCLNEMNGPVFKIKDDPRLTGLGVFLRKTSLDELPQLWNVFKGNMSLVGPRPLPIKENKYEPWQRRRLSVKPGITCLWQINGRNAINDFNEWVKLDLEYIDRWSLGLDFKILFKTIPAVLFRKGAR